MKSKAKTTEATIGSAILKVVASGVTGATHGMVSMGLAWACLSVGMFSPVGIVFMVAAIVNFIVNSIFYSRDTLRITTWMSPSTARYVWSEVFDQPGQWFKKGCALFAAFIGLAEIEAQLRIKDFGQRKASFNLSETDYENLYAALRDLDQALISLDPDFLALSQKAKRNDGLHARHRLVDYALRHEVYRLHVFNKTLETSAETSAETPTTDVPQCIEKHYDAYRKAKISENPASASWLPAELDLHLVGCRLWLQDHMANLQKKPAYLDERKELMAYLVDERQNVRVDALGSSVRNRQIVTSLFFTLSLMLSLGMALLLMRGLESFFLTLGMSAAMFTPLGFTLVAICFFCILFQLYVTLNEFWVDAYWHQGFSWDRLLNRFKSWLTGDHLTTGGKWIPNPNRRMHTAKRLLTGMFFLGVIAMAVVATWGFYQSFTLSLQKVFSGQHALVQLSGRVYDAVYWLLTVSALARLSMALVMMARGFWTTVTGLTWFFGRYVNARARHAWAHLISHDQEAQKKYQAEVEGHREKAYDILYNLFMSSVLSPINTVANLNWVTSGHGMPVPLMMTAAAVQSQLLISKNGRREFEVNRFSLISLYFKAYVEAGHPIKELINDHGECDFDTTVNQLSLKSDSREALWHRACLLALFCLGKCDLSGDQVKALWGDDMVSSREHIQLIIPDSEAAFRMGPDGVPHSAEDFAQLANAIYVELAYAKLPRLRMVRTWNRLRRLWRQGLVNWLAKGLGVGGALWFLTAMLDHHGVFAGLAPAVGVLIPALVFLASLALVALATESLSATDGGKSEVALGDYLNKFAKTFGSAGVAWALVSILAAFGLSVPFLGVGAVALAFVMGVCNLRYNWDGAYQELSDFWYKVLGSGAAVWFLGSAIGTCLTAAGVAFAATTFHVVLASLVLACVLYAAYDVYCDYFKGNASQAQGKVLERPTSLAADLNPEHFKGKKEQHAKREVVVRALGPRFFDRAILHETGPSGQVAEPVGDLKTASVP